MKELKRALKTTFKQISRSGWLSWASIGVMTLSFLVTTSFLLIAFVMNLVLKSIENDPHIYVFFNPGTNEEKILGYKADWEKLGNIDSVVYTSEKDALEEFKDYNEKSNPITAEAIRENVLPASLGIRLESIEDANEIINLMEQTEQSDSEVLKVGYSETTIQNIKDLVNLIRIGGGIIVGLLIIVILLFTLLTVEFRIYNRSEEIGIMQLVGGSLGYIRLPFILESSIYGAIGAFLSNLIILGSYWAVVSYYSSSDLIRFTQRFFGSLDWPSLTIIDFSTIFLLIILIGAIMGGINSFIAIRRYIK